MTNLNIRNHPSFEALLGEVKDEVTKSLVFGGDPPHDSGMESRLSKLEGAYDGIRQSQSILKAGVVGFGALVLAAVSVVVVLQVFTYGRLDGVEAKVDALPNKIAESVRETNRSFSDALNAAIQATRQQPPPVIVVPQQSSPTKP